MPDSVKIVEEIVLSILKDYGAMKGTELVAMIVKTICTRDEHNESSSFITKELLSIPVPDVLNNLVANGQIREVEYVLPYMRYRTKSIYFPSTTEISIVPLPEIKDVA
jgi:hypothetical protein